LNGENGSSNWWAGVGATEDELATVLMAGYVGGVLDIFALSNRGAAGSMEHAVLPAIRSGRPHATVAYLILRNWNLRLHEMVESRCHHGRAYRTDVQDAHPHASN
jgi:hypothetical protein